MGTDVYCFAETQYRFWTGILIVIGRTCLMTSPIWSHTDWLTSFKICIVGLGFAKLEMDKTVHLKLFLPLSGVWQEEMSTLIEHQNLLTHEK